MGRKPPTRSFRPLDSAYGSVYGLITSPWAGRKIGLEFNRQLAGQIRVHPLDFKAFALAYHDVRIESREAAATQ